LKTSKDENWRVPSLLWIIQPWTVLTFWWNSRSETRLWQSSREWPIVVLRLGVS
jgi:hypothetical protein